MSEGRVGTLLVVSGPAPVARVWQRYAEPARWPSWAPHLRAVSCSTVRLQAGATGWVHGPLGLAVPFTVDAVDQQRLTWSWTVRPRVRGRTLIEVGLDHAVAPGPAGGCTTWLRIRAPRPVAAAYRPVARLALRRLVAR